MTTDDKRKLTSRLNALNSTGPKTPEGKLRSAGNSVTHGAYAQSLVLRGEDPADFQAVINKHLEKWKPTDIIEELFVREMATTLWRLGRQAPAELNLIDIQMQRMSPVLEAEFETTNSHGLYALAVDALQGQGDALSQIARQGRRLLSQYEKLARQLLDMRRLFPPAPPQENEPVENIQVEDREEPAPEPEPQPSEIPVETNLLQTASYPPLAAKNRVRNPHSGPLCSPSPDPSPERSPHGAGAPHQGGQNHRRNNLNYGKTPPNSFQ